MIMNGHRFGWLLGCAIGCSTLACLAQGTDIISLDRRIDWTQVGIPGGIPVRNTIFTNFQAGASVSAVQSAVDKCPNGQVVFLGPGIYTWNTPLNLSANGVTIRGAGPNSTIISHNVSGYNGGITVQSGVLSGNAKTIQLFGGFTKGSTNLVLSAPDSSLHPGFHVTVDQLNDGVLVNNNGVGGLRTDTTPEADGLRSMTQTLEVRSISNGTNLTVWPPLYWTFQSSLKPQIYYRPSSAATYNYVLWSGVEDLCLSNRNASGEACLLFNRAAYCWAKNIKTANAAVYHIHFWRSFRSEVRHSECNGTLNTTASHGYGIDLDYQSCANLIEDNIVANNRDFIKAGSGSSGNVFAYNYHTNCLANTDAPRFSPHAGGHHSAHPMMNLWEGNVTYKWVSDFYWGSVSHSTLLRNWFKGSAGTPYAAQSGAAVVADENNTYFNIVGNLLGCPELSTSSNWRVKNPTRISPQTHDYEYSYATFRIGYYSDGDTGGGNSGADEWSSHIVGGNYDYVTGRQDWYNPSSPQSIASSYLYASKPAYFGSLQWPPFDAGNPASSKEVSIPAGYRWVNGIDPSGGTAQNQPPTAVANGTPKSGTAPLSVSFSSAGSSDPDGTVLTFNWTFGDGTSSTSANPTHIYQNAGIYSARLVVSDGTNTTASGSISITVSSGAGNQSPTVIAGASPTSGIAPLTVSFSSAGSTDPEGTALTYSWTFGDGGNSTAANPTHSYSSPGNYVARLTVSDGTNSATSTNLSITALAQGAGLVAAYGFNEGTGSNTTDSSGNGNTGTLIGTAWTSGKNGQALSFNGTGSLVTIPDSPSLHLSEALTIEAWVFPTAVSNGWMPIAFKPLTNSQISFVLQGATPQSGVPSLFVSPATDNLWGSNPLSINTWSHLAGTYDGSVLRLYVNGIQVATKAQSGNLGYSNEALTLGGNTLFQAFWQGSIDDVRIYNRALSVAEIQTDMGAAVGPKPAPPENLHIVNP
jgi:PKD repeat protein